jgi:hypothetical protein
MGKTLAETKRERWTLTFEGMPGHSAPVGRRVAGLLKMARRAFGLRCVSVAEPRRYKAEGQDACTGAGARPAAEEPREKEKRS